MPNWRRAQRANACNSGTAAIIASKHTEIMLLLLDVHEECVRLADSADQGVTQAARMGGFLDCIPNAAGLRPVEGEVWEHPAFTSGSSRMTDAVLKRPRAWVAQHDGTPPEPDWN